MGSAASRFSALAERCAAPARQFLARLKKGSPRDFRGGSLPGGAALLEKLPQGLFCLDVFGVIRFGGGAWRELTGRSAEQSCGHVFLKYLHPKDQGSCRAFLQQVRSGSAPEAGLRLRLLMPEGTPRWFLLRAEPLGPVPDAAELLGTLDDIGEIMQAEEITRAHYRGLENLVGQLPGMLYRCRNDRHWTMEYVSVGSAVLCGYQPDEIINNHSVAFADLIYTGDRERVRSEVRLGLRESRDFELYYRLVGRGGRMCWVLERGRGVFTTSGMLLGLEGIILEASRGAIAERESRRLVLHEEQSGLPTPLLFLDRLRRAIRRAHLEGQGFILMLLSVDRCGELQQRLGKDYETHLLPELGRRLIETLGPLDSLCLLENDGLYALLLAVSPGVSKAVAAARQLQGQAQAPLPMPEEADLQVTVSIGIVLEEDGRRDAETLLAAGRAALSRAHSLGGARFELEDPSGHALVALRGATARELEAALRAEELQLHWQPVIELASGAPHALESRLVWPHQHRGLLFAEQFVPDLEDSRQVTALWEWVFREMRRQMESWRRAADVGMPPGGILVSGTTLLDADAILRLADFLLSGWRSTQPLLMLGITETVLGARSRAVEGMLKRISGSGIHLMLDAFGSGDTALLWRRRCIDLVRLEALAADEEQTGRLIRVAQQLDLETLAHQVDQPEQLESLRRAEVDYVQGEAVAPLLSPDRVSEYLAMLVCPGRGKVSLKTG